jgi:hypothetical protein
MTEQTERKQIEITIRDKKLIIESPGIEFYLVKLPNAVANLGAGILALEPIYQNLKNDTTIQTAETLRALAKIGEPLFDIFLEIVNYPIKYRNQIAIEKNPDAYLLPLMTLDWIHTFTVTEAKILLKAVFEVLDKKELTDFFVEAKTQINGLGFQNLTKKQKK